MRTNDHRLEIEGTYWVAPPAYKYYCRECTGGAVLGALLLRIYLVGTGLPGEPVSYSATDLYEMLEGEYSERSIRYARVWLIRQGLLLCVGTPTNGLRLGLRINLNLLDELQASRPTNWRDWWRSEFRPGAEPRQNRQGSSSATPAQSTEVPPTDLQGVETEPRQNRQRSSLFNNRELVSKEKRELARSASPLAEWETEVQRFLISREIRGKTADPQTVRRLAAITQRVPEQRQKELWMKLHKTIVNDAADGFGLLITIARGFLEDASVAPTNNRVAPPKTANNRHSNGCRKPPGWEMSSEAAHYGAGGR